MTSPAFLLRRFAIFHRITLSARASTFGRDRLTILAFGFPILRLPQYRLWILDVDHRITLSALANTFGGIVNPICFAAFRLMMNSNFFGCSTGRSAGLVPFKILST